MDRNPKQLTHRNKERVGKNLTLETGWEEQPLPILEQSVSLARLRKKAETLLA